MSIGICHCHCLCICLCLCCCLKMKNRWLHLNLENLNLTEYLFILSWTDDISKLLLHWAVSGEEEDQRDQYDGNAGQLSMVLFYLCLQEQIFGDLPLLAVQAKSEDSSIGDNFTHSLHWVTFDMTLHCARMRAGFSPKDGWKWKWPNNKWNAHNLMKSCTNSAKRPALLLWFHQASSK